MKVQVYSPPALCLCFNVLAVVLLVGSVVLIFAGFPRDAVFLGASAVGLFITGRSFEFWARTAHFSEQAVLLLARQQTVDAPTPKVTAPIGPEPILYPEAPGDGGSSSVQAIEAAKMRMREAKSLYGRETG